MPLKSYKKAIWKGIEGHLKGIVQKLEVSHPAKGQFEMMSQPFQRVSYG